jgi:DNA helicase-2/ATP-dependent DNA helicase PcrA
MVIAGPGTGKTQILTLRIANILKRTDASPENILALTFTESGARAMRERLVRYIGAPAYRVPIQTFHEFAGRCIRLYPDSYDRAVGGRPITDLEKIKLFESILETPTVTRLRPRGNPEFYIKPIIEAISLMKREYITPEKFGAIIENQQAVFNAIPKIHEKGAHKGKVRSEYRDMEKSLDKNKELLFVYRAYEASLAAQKHFDFDDMIFRTVEAMERDETMLRSLQEEYQYILADEHQDVNGSQNRILELLASYHERPNIFVVGDEKQSIYRFQGASLENFLYFEDKFSHAKIIALTENYRSVQPILDISHRLIAVHDGPLKDLRLPLKATRQAEALIEYIETSHEAVEHEMIAEKMKDLVKTGIPMEEIAVIVRTNREVGDIASFLRGSGFAVESSADSDILSHPITLSVRTLIEAVVAPGNERTLFEILHSAYVDLPASDLVKITGSRSYARPLAQIIEDQEFLASLGLKAPDNIFHIAKILKEARQMTATEPPHRVLQFLIRKTGLLDHVMAEHPEEGSRVLRRIYDEIEEMVRHEREVTLSDVKSMFEIRITHMLPLSAPFIHTERSAVQVMTAHKAKGLEFRHVFIPHLTDNKWGGKPRMNYFDIPVTTHLSCRVDEIDDERKLFYVALTRAKEGLHLSSSKSNTEGRTLLRTRLLEDLEKITQADARQFEERFDPSSVLGAQIEKPLVDPAILKETLLERGLSVTALNNYIRDPWNYFYRNVLRIPEVQSESAQFGTAVHDTLRSIMKHNRDHGKLPDMNAIKAYLERELGRLPITPQEFVRSHEHALSTLVAYIEHVKKSLPPETKEEFKIQTALPTGNPEFPEVLITGLLDRLDFDSDGRVIAIVDYKTGKPRTRGYIEGKTKDSTGDYKRQLVFYALLLSLYGDERYACKNGTLSFVEADEKGVIHEESYVITDEEIEDLKKEIVRIALEIANGAFLSAPCDPEKSDYCHLASQLRMSKG